LTWNHLFSKETKRGHVPPPRTVRGHFQIAAAALPNPEYSRTSGWWAGVLTGVGITPAAVIHEESALIEKWPEEGQVVPVVITLSSPIKFKIVWDNVPTRREKGLQRAQDLLNTMTFA
jgi:hypothetical protein